MKNLVLSIAMIVCLSGYSRTYNFKFVGGNTAKIKKSAYFNDITKNDTFQIEIGTSSKNDCDDDIEIRAATLMKHIQSKKSVVNDIASFVFTPSQKEKKSFLVKSGTAAGTRDKATYLGGDYSSGYIKGGVIIELWQNGKCIKHWSSATGPVAKTTLSDQLQCAYINSKGYESTRESFDNNTKIVSNNDSKTAND